MNNTISVITAVDPSRSAYLHETWDSLASQQLPSGWAWEWLVQIDSIDPADQSTVLSQLPNDDRISVSASRHGGPGTARTMALARSAGHLIKTLDADDRLIEGALARDIRAHSERGILWSGCRVIDNNDGRHTDHYNIPTNPRSGRVSSGSVYLAYRDSYRMLVHPATLCVKFGTLIALGGWMALPASEDTGLLLALDAVGDGWFINAPGLLYRRWAPQMSAMPQHSDTTELEARRSLITARAEALTELFGSW